MVGQARELSGGPTISRALLAHMQIEVVLLLVKAGLAELSTDPSLADLSVLQLLSAELPVGEEVAEVRIILASSLHKFVTHRRPRSFRRLVPIISKEPFRLFLDGDSLNAWEERVMVVGGRLQSVLGMARRPHDLLPLFLLLQAGLVLKNERGSSYFVWSLKFIKVVVMGIQVG